MDLSFIIRQRLKELELEQRDLAAAAQVTESYISQLLSRKKAPPAVERTDLYERMDVFLEFPPGHLSSIVQAQRLEGLKRKLAESPTPLFREARELIIRKCNPQKRNQLREIFEEQAFGELERLISQTLLHVAKGVAREELKDEKRLRRVGKFRHQCYEEARKTNLEFLDTDVFNISIEHCSAFLNPVIEAWDIDLKTFAMEVTLDKRVAPGRILRFQFVETSPLPAAEEEPGFREFLRTPEMSGDATAEEVAFLKNLGLRRMKPSALYYYRELQSLRDPLHFPRLPRDSKSPHRGKRSIDQVKPGMPKTRTKRP
jgi:transcriptional regulator with XRE-family HTH domain